MSRPATLRSYAIPLALTLLLTGLAGGAGAPIARSANWQPTNLGIVNAQARDLAVAPSQPARVYLGLTGLGVYRTDNRGSSWAARSSGLPANATIRALAAAATDADLVFAGVGGSVYKTTNGGARWSAASSGIDASYVQDLLVHATDPQLVYAALSGGNAPGIYKTANGGGTWAWLSSVPGSTAVYALAAHPANPDVLLGGVDDGAVRSTDGGATWSPGGNPGVRFRSVSWSAASPYWVYARASNDVYRSEDEGVTFTSVPSPGGYSVDAIAAHPLSYLSLVAAGTGYGCAPFNEYREFVWKTTSGGDSWSGPLADPQCNTGVPTALAFDPIDPSHVYLSENGVRQRGFRHSSDGGSSWTTKISGIRNFEVSVIVDRDDRCVVRSRRPAGRIPLDPRDGVRGESHDERSSLRIRNRCCGGYRVRLSQSEHGRRHELVAGHFLPPRVPADRGNHPRGRHEPRQRADRLRADVLRPLPE